MWFRLICAACLVSVLSAARADDATAVSTGQFTYRVPAIDLMALPAKGWYQAIVGFQITNTGSVPVRLALVPAWPTLQLIGVGLNFTLKGGGVSGIPFAGDNRVGNCTGMADNFVTIRPGYSANGNLVLEVNAGPGDSSIALAKHGRFSANLMVQSMDDKKCWIEAFGAPEVTVRSHL